MSTELIQMLGEKVTEQIGRIYDRLDALADTVKQATDSNTRLVEFTQRLVQDQNARIESRFATMEERFNSVEARFNSVEARIDNLRYWLIGVGLTVLLGIGGLVLMLHQSNQQMISNIVSILQQLGRLPPS